MDGRQSNGKPVGERGLGEKDSASGGGFHDQVAAVALSGKREGGGVSQ